MQRTDLRQPRGRGRRWRPGAEEDLAAGGSLTRPEPARLPRLERRIWLWCELVVFYIGAPLAIAYAILAHGVPLFVALQPVLLAFILYLLWDDGFLLRRELSLGVPLTTIAWILVTFLIVGGAIAALTYWVYPGRFLAMPRYNPELWQLIMIGYPLASVIPQELVYRTFFFHRYGPLFGGRRWLAIVLNGLLFGFAHIVFGNWIAILGTAVIGILLAYRYETTRAFWAVWLEHALYGCLVFTIGLGRFFFTGVSNLL